MAFLYVGLGLAMISGISAMMQVGNNLNNLILLSTFKRNEYYQSNLPSYDRRILETLRDYSGTDAEVCTVVKENFNDTLYGIGFESNADLTHWKIKKPWGVSSEN